jgi:cell division protein FtsL
LKKISTKISLFLLIGIIFTACNTVKRVPEGKRLLTKNEIVVNDQITKDEAIGNLLYQNPTAPFWDITCD